MHKLMLSRIFCLVTLFISLPSFSKTGDIYIDGDITHRNYGAGYVLTAAEFNTLEKHHIKTTTSWTELGHVVDFEGVKFKDLLNVVGARGKTLRMRALNDYWVDIPVSDVEEFDMLLANKMDGKPLKVRDFGPYFVIYPMDKFYGKLNTPVYQARHIWQVSGITVLDK
ncbi:molybdopterin-dependent oxidoreductase [Serratia ureilytica]|uniref:molybdopterin-dependent oxidoreductase n=1 Tax=Serratia ureilytica TaxID=300181 RepID=UPI00159C3968|nr:molybdopterin-dependent oxidoreductase [Serratia ureilytica]MBH2717843.1 molybdopterin-dependent oxidoreductase [Serratia marcescens]NVM51664.1 molybdopterin-dependent oxidoreductase [Serratia ureilytica]